MVVYFELNIEIVLTTLEGKALDVIDAGLIKLQINDQYVLAISQPVFALLSGIQGPPRCTGIGSISPGQSALSDIQLLRIVIEELKSNLRIALVQWIFGQFQLNDIATTRINRQLQHIGFYTDQISAGGSRVDRFVL